MLDVNDLHWFNVAVLELISYELSLLATFICSGFLIAALVENLSTEVRAH